MRHAPGSATPQSTDNTMRYAGIAIAIIAVLDIVVVVEEEVGQNR